MDEFIESSWTQQDTVFETPLRPQSLAEFIGQDILRQRLEVLIGAAKMRKEPIGHCLFFGPPGLGKTTLAGIIAKAMGTQLVTTSGPALEKAGDLAGILSNLKEGDILFIDEVHRLPRQVEEYLYPAVEDFKLDLLIDSGPAARSVQIKLQPFTLVAATTRAGLVSAPMRSRFVFSCRLDYSRARTSCHYRDENFFDLKNPYRCRRSKRNCDARKRNPADCQQSASIRSRLHADARKKTGRSGNDHQSPRHAGHRFFGLR